MEANTLAELMGTGLIPPADAGGNTGNVPPANPEPAPTAPVPVPPTAVPVAPDPAAVAEVTPAPAPTSKDTKLFAGKYTSPEELEKGHVNLEAKFREQAAELGAYRKMLETQKQPEPTPPTPTDLKTQFDQSLQQLDAQVDSGQISQAQYQQQRDTMLVNFAAAQTEARVMARMTAEQQAKDAQQREQQFASENPRFVQLLQSGELKAFFDANSQKLGLMDKYDAYYAYMAQDAQTQLAQTKQMEPQLIAAAREEGRKQALAELTTKAAGGGNAAAASPPSSGQGMQTLPDQPATLDQIVAESLRAIHGSG